MLRPNPYPGKLIVVEGIDGSGKSTQIDLLYKWLRTQGWSIHFSEWNSSQLVRSTTRQGKKRRTLTPTTFSLLHATDFADRWENSISPLLRAGAIVLADRYCFTGFARDVARGVDPVWVRNLYSFAALPDIALYFRVPLDIATERIRFARSKLKFYEAGQDLGLADDRWESFRLFQQRIIDEYEKMVVEFGLTAIDGTLPIQVQQEKVRRLTRAVMKDWRGLLHPQAAIPGATP